MFEIGGYLTYLSDLQLHVVKLLWNFEILDLYYKLKKCIFL